MSAGATYAGKIDATGVFLPVTGAVAPGDRLFGADVSGKPAVIAVAGPDGALRAVAAPSPFSPVFRLALSPEKAATDNPAKVAPPAGGWSELFLPLPPKP